MCVPFPPPLPPLLLIAYFLSTVTHLESRVYYLVIGGERKFSTGSLTNSLCNQDEGNKEIYYLRVSLVQSYLSLTAVSNIIVRFTSVIGIKYSNCLYRFLITARNIQT